MDYVCTSLQIVHVKNAFRCILDVVNALAVVQCRKQMCTRTKIYVQISIITNEITVNSLISESDY